MTDQPAIAGGKRGYSWPAFPPGHELSTVHGAYSPRRIAPLAEQIKAEILADPQTPEYVQSYPLELDALCVDHAIIRLLLTYIDTMDLPDVLADVTVTEEKRGRGKAEIRTRHLESVLKQLDRVANRAGRRRVQLGLTPLSRSRIGRDIGAARLDVAQAFARLRAAQDDGSTS